MPRTQIILTVGGATYFNGYVGRTAVQLNVTGTGIFTRYIFRFREKLKMFREGGVLIIF